ncbi:shikimate dehydrogenase family protein [Parabacteroides sp. FAFU027]|uniref:shikimate dehydrogenase family protein n=1 Tax=Parabacteroides sp. FAFU027 TaxID=2922715 RepID=UPI001FAFA6A8|nr:shikimate dehydrogenase [Parabacteroides sp. FAFU027]
MQKYGLIGYPLSHSFSQGFFNEKFQSEGIEATYENFEIPTIEDLQKVLLANPELNGLNVTIPYKEQVIQYLDELDDTAKNIGAVNVIKFVRDKKKLKLKGYNSDVIGFSQSISAFLKPHHKKALILGTGGASKAVKYALEKLGIEYTFVSRTAIKGQLFYNELTEEVMKEHTVIVNTTPVGMYPKIDACPDIPYQYITEQHLLYDLLYNPNETKFMKLGEEKGATVVNGLEMLLLQAFAAWDIWQQKL